MAWPEITDTFDQLSCQVPRSPPESTIKKLERFVVIMYCRTSDDEDVNSARMTLFTRNSRSIDNIPPTKAALEEHIKSRKHLGSIDSTAASVTMGLGKIWERIQTNVDNSANCQKGMY